MEAQAGGCATCKNLPFRWALGYFYRRESCVHCLTFISTSDPGFFHGLWLNSSSFKVVVKLYMQTLWRIRAPSTLAWRRPHLIAPHQCITYFSNYTPHIFILLSDWLVVSRQMEQEQVSVAALWFVPTVALLWLQRPMVRYDYVWLLSIHPDLALIFCGWQLWFLMAQTVWIPRLYWSFLSLAGAFISGRRSSLANRFSFSFRNVFI